MLFGKFMKTLIIAFIAITALISCETQSYRKTSNGSSVTETVVQTSVLQNSDSYHRVYDNGPIHMETTIVKQDQVKSVDTWGKLKLGEKMIEGAVSTGNDAISAFSD